jgi:hypothetical protein
MLNQVIRVTPLPNYHLEIEFQDGVYGIIDLSDRLFGEMFEPLRDEAVFRKVSIDEFGAIYWPNGADLAPDAVHRTFVRRRFPVLAHSRLAANATISTREECMEQLLEAFMNIADHDDVLQAAERLARVRDWLARKTDISEPASQSRRRVSN